MEMRDQPLNSVAMIGTEVASAMLDALLDQPNSESENEQDIPISDKKRFLVANINSLMLTDKRDLGNILIMNNRRSAIKECSEGSVINLDVLPDYIVTQMYDLMSHKLANP